MRLVRVNGPPGTGKTTYLAAKVDEVATKYGGGAVIVASLTKAAAAEVTGRKTKVPPNNIGTLHSHAFQALKRPTIAETTAGIRSWNEWVGVPSLRIDPKIAVDPEHAAVEPVPMDSDGAVLLNEANILRQQMIDRQFWPPKVARFDSKWREWKSETKYLDFTDLIENCIANEVPLAQNPVVMFVDEAQDMSKLEFALAMHWGSACDWVMIVGDADQNLYQWRGSDPEAFTALEAEEVRTLEQSYRVPAAVHKVAVDWIEQIEGRESVVYKSRESVGNVRRVQHTYRDPTAMLSEIATAVEVAPDNDWPAVMVLTSCTYMLQPLLVELRKHGIPFYNPYRVKQGAWNPLRGGRRLLSFVAPLTVTDGGEGRLWTWKDVKAWMEPLQARGVLARGAKTFVEAKCEAGRFGKDDTRENEVPSIDDIMRLMHDDEGREAVFRCDIDWWEAHLRNDDHKRQQYALTVARRRGFDALRGQPRLCVGTIHSVKGGQADVVYLFPDLSNVGFFEGWQRRGAGRDAIIRQFYVGMTRAREELVLCSPSSATTINWR